MEDTHTKHRLTPFDVLSFFTVMLIVGWLLVVTIYGINADSERKLDAAAQRDRIENAVKIGVEQRQQILDKVNAMEKRVIRIESTLKKLSDK